MRVVQVVRRHATFLEQHQFVRCLSWQHIMLLLLLTKMEQGNVTQLNTNFMMPEDLMQKQGYRAAM